MGMAHRLDRALGTSFSPGIGSSVTADENEMTAKRRVSGDRAHSSRQSSSVLTRDVGSRNSGSTIVAMMQTTRPRHRNHLVTADRIAILDEPKPKVSAEEIGKLLFMP